MNKGFGMWIMSKLVMFIFLFSLVAMLSSYYLIYQDKVIDDTAKEVAQSVAESITDALSYREAVRTIWLSSNVWVRDTSRPYTLYIYYAENVGENLDRLVIFLAWNDHDSRPSTFASAAAVNLVSDGEDTSYTINHVCLYDIDSDGGIAQDDSLLIRPSAANFDDRANYIIVYKFGDKLCIASKNANAGLSSAINALKGECGNCD